MEFDNDGYGHLDRMRHITGTIRLDEDVVPPTTMECVIDRGDDASNSGVG